MADTNLFSDLKNALNDFKTFLDKNTPVIAPAVKALKSILPQIGDMLSKLIDLMGKLKTAVQNLDVSSIGADKLAAVSQFTTSATTLLNTAAALLPAEQGPINEALSAMNVVGSLPSLNDVKTEVVSLIDAITTQLNTLNA